MWLLQVVSGLWFLHSALIQAVVHLDIKPSNVVLSLDRKVANLADMGLAKLCKKEMGSSD